VSGRKAFGTGFLLLGIVVLLAPIAMPEPWRPKVNVPLPVGLALIVAGILILRGKLRRPDSASAGRQPAAAGSDIHGWGAPQFRGKDQFDTVSDLLSRGQKLEAIKAIREAKSCTLEEAKRIADQLQLAVNPRRHPPV
jgi:ribosomal protein L7/L12